MSLCGAKLRKKDQTCRQAAMPNGRCRLHGGKSLGGIASPRFKHGRYSKHVMFQPPAPGMACLDRVSQDTADVGLRQEIALVTAAVQQLIREHLDQPTDPDMPMRAYVRALQSAHWRRDAAQLRALLRTPPRTGGRNFTRQARWREIRHLMTVKARLVVIETRRIATTRDFVSTKAVNQLLARVGRIIRRHVLDRSVRARIRDDVRHELIRMDRPGAMPDDPDRAPAP
jgi:hypothetical protein